MTFKPNINNRFYILLMGLFFAIQELSAQPFHSLSLEKSEGSSPSFANIVGSRVLIIVTSLDSDLDLTGIVELQMKYQDLLIIELPVQVLAKSKKNIYKNSSARILIAKETKDSADINGQLLSWLTKKEANHHFVVENLVVGQKFFIDGKGELYAILPPDFKLTDPRIDAILTRSAFPQTDNK